ncbi:GtrA family protein [Lysinibacillus sp. BW-2-10]|uniref:GtrA family protein n=1 Tax=Lysinibacillus sp. BW-2-10 TaxID=2590030 RepID=UPI001180A62A|nr:GtrA family protein [Lysinibacillus sp. BW-2-10]TSI10710.1 GtrA family protein [Lysinibacillus sp. BW-2-10]
MLLQKEVSIRFLKYSLVGCICTLIYFISVFLLVELFHQEPLLGTAIAFIVMTVFSFYLNKRFTFGSNFSSKKLLRFFTVALVGFVLNFAIIFLIVNVMAFHYFIGELVTILIIPVINFILNNYWTFQ